MSNPVDIRPDHLEIVQHILREHLPMNVKVWVFGSRVNWTTKDSSDLDLAVEGSARLDHKAMSALEMAFEESDLPYVVDVVDLNTVGHAFKQIVEEQRAPLPIDGEGAKVATAEEWRDSIYGSFRADYLESSLEDLCEEGRGIQTGPFGSQLHQRDYVATGTPIITVEHLGNNRITSQDIPNVSDHDRDRLSKYIIQEGDIIFSRVGSVDRRSLVRRTEKGWLFSGRCLRVRPNQNRIDPAYLSYFFGMPAFQEYIRSIAVGATMPSLNTKILKEVPILYPTLSEQRAIAQVLGTLDEKIELNRRMNETLEEMARALFKSWFVDFEPVRAKMEGRWRRGESLSGLPAELYELFPDRLAPSELGEIPEVWEVRRLGDVVELAYGKALRAIDRKEGSVPVYGSNGQVGWHDKELVSGPGIVVGRKGNPGIVTWTHGDFFPIDTTFYVVPRDSDLGIHFLFYALIHQNLPSVSADSAVPGLNRNLAYMNSQLVPDRKVAHTFNDLAETNFKQRQQLEIESLTLAAQRDVLLPGLVSGEVKLESVQEYV